MVSDARYWNCLKATRRRQKVKVNNTTSTVVQPSMASHNELSLGLLFLHPILMMYLELSSLVKYLLLQMMMWSFIIVIRGKIFLQT